MTAVPAPRHGFVSRHRVPITIAILLVVVVVMYTQVQANDYQAGTSTWSAASSTTGQHDVLVLYLPSYVDSSFVAALEKNYTGFERYSGIILVVQTDGGDTVATAESIALLQGLNRTIISYVEYGFSGGFLVPELTSSWVFINTWGMYGFGHNSSWSWGTSWSGQRGIPRAWSTVYSEIAGDVAQKRGINQSMAYQELPNLYLGKDAVKARIADQVAPDLNYVQAMVVEGLGHNVTFTAVEMP